MNKTISNDEVIRQSIETGNPAFETPSVEKVSGKIRGTKQFKCGRAWAVVTDSRR